MEYNYKGLLGNLFEYYRDETNYDDFVDKFLSSPVYDFNDLTKVENLYKAYEDLIKLSNTVSYNKNSKYYHDENVYICIDNNLAYLSGYYNKKEKQEGNWWYWRIGIPNLLLKILITIVDREECFLSYMDRYKDALNKFLVPYTSKSDMTYANLASICRNVFVMGVVYKDDKLTKKGLNDASPAFAKVNNCKAKIANDTQKFLIKNKWFPAKAWMTSGKEGLYDDGTFLQHTSISYIGTYGLEIIEYAALICSVFETPLDVLDKKIVDVLPTWIKAYHMAIYDNQVLLAYCGRSIETVNTVENARIINKYISEVENVIGKSEFDEKEEFVCIQENGGVAIFNTPEWRFVVKMASDKVARYEYFNWQNKNGFNQSNGMSYLYIKGDRQYIDHSIAELDYHRLPGTTADISKEPSGTTSEQPRFDYTTKDLDNMSIEVRPNGTEFIMNNQLSIKNWYFDTYKKSISCYGSSITGDTMETIVDSRCGNFKIYYQKAIDEWIEVTNGLNELEGSAIYIEGVGVFDIDNDFYIEKTDSRYIIGIKHNDIINRHIYLYDIYPLKTKEDFKK